MLVLTRMPNETIRIGSEVVVTVLSVKGNQIKIGVKAPQEVPVHREEIYKRIQDQAEISMPNQLGGACNS